MNIYMPSHSFKLKVLLNITLLLYNMPQPVKITVKNMVYTTPILNGEMDDVNNQIESTKAEIASLKEHLQNAYNNLQNLNNQFMALYIQQTGSFPIP